MLKLFAARDGDPQSKSPFGAIYLYWGSESPRWDELRKRFVSTEKSIRMGEVPMLFPIELKPGEWKEVSAIIFKEKETK